MLKQEPRTKFSVARILESAKDLRRDLGNSETEVKVSITGGGGHTDVGGPISVACEFDVTGKTYDDVNGPYNELTVEHDCKCSQPAQNDDESWSIHCNCP